MLGNRDVYFFQSIVNNCSIPEIFLFFEVVDEEGFVLSHIVPGFEIRKSI